MNANFVISKLFVIGCFFLQTSSAQVLYNGYSLMRVTPITDSQLQYLMNLAAIPDNGMDFWLTTTAINHPADVMIQPMIADSLRKNLTENKIPYEILIPDIGKWIEIDINEELPLPKKYEFYKDYRSTEEISQYLRKLAKSHPEFITLHAIGTSFEGRNLEVLQISTDPSLSKPAIWIQGGQHAREQIAPAVVIFMACKITSMINNDEDMNELIDTFDWYFLPVLNPDGYNYAQTNDRLWRKSRSKTQNSKNCTGVDLNRNWDIKWNASGASHKPCSSVYAGTHPFSEPETKSVSDFMMENLDGRLEMFVDFHSYSQRWLTPWGYTSELPASYKEQKRLAEIGTSALQKFNGTKYSVGSSGNIMYTVSGGARDWVFKEMEAKYSYVVELRDEGDYGFLLPKCQILPTALETWEAIKAMSLELCQLI